MLAGRFVLGVDLSSLQNVKYGLFLTSTIQK